MSDAASAIRVEVAYADDAVQLLRVVSVPAATTVGQAIAMSNILAAIPTGFAVSKVGIFGRIVALDETPGDGDRIELYRPLKIDPKEARRRRAATRR